MSNPVISIGRVAELFPTLFSEGRVGLNEIDDRISEQELIACINHHYDALHCSSGPLHNHHYSAVSAMLSMKLSSLGRLVRDNPKTRYEDVQDLIADICRDIVPALRGTIWHIIHGTVLSEDCLRSFLQDASEYGVLTNRDADSITTDVHNMVRGTLNTHIRGMRGLISSNRSHYEAFKDYWTLLFVMEHEMSLLEVKYSVTTAFRHTLVGNTWIQDKRFSNARIEYFRNISHTPQIRHKMRIRRLLMEVHYLNTAHEFLRDAELQKALETTMDDYSVLMFGKDLNTQIHDWCRLDLKDIDHILFLVFKKVHELNALSNQIRIKFGNDVIHSFMRDNF